MVHPTHQKQFFSRVDSLCAQKDWHWALEQVIEEAGIRVRDKDAFDRAYTFALEGLKLFGKERSLCAKLLIGALPFNWGMARVGESSQHARKRANAKTRRKEKARRIIEEVAAEFPL